MRTLALASTLIAASMLAACSGGGASGGGTPPVSQPTTNPGGNPGPDPNGFIADSIAAMNSIGAPVQGSADSNDLGGGGAGKSGTCTSGTEFWSPDKNGDANSTERIKFFDNACTQMAVDTVRTFTSTGANAETVTRVITKYAQGSTTPLSVRNETVNYSNGTFDGYGFPIVSSGLLRTATSTLMINGSLAGNSSDEYLAGAAQTSNGTTSMAYCGDAAGFSVTGIQALSETFGWSNMTDANNGTRSSNSATPNTVTFQSNRIGSSYGGPIGSMSIVTGSANTTCPIATPLYTVNVSGGSTQGNFRIPISETFVSGYLTNLTVTGGVLAHGELLNVTTNATASGNPKFITGTLTSSSNSPIASFNVSAYGIGSLVLVTGQSYQIVDWHVVS